MSRVTYVATISHVTPEGDDILLATVEERCAPLRLLRTRMKHLGRASGLPFHLTVYKKPPPNWKPSCGTKHHFRCLAGRGHRGAA